MSEPMFTNVRVYDTDNDCAPYPLDLGGPLGAQALAEVINGWREGGFAGGVNEVGTFIATPWHNVTCITAEPVGEDQ